MPAAAFIRVSWSIECVVIRDRCAASGVPSPAAASLLLGLEKQKLSRFVGFLLRDRAARATDNRSPAGIWLLVLLTQIRETSWQRFLMPPVPPGVLTLNHSAFFLPHPSHIHFASNFITSTPCPD